MPCGLRLRASPVRSAEAKLKQGPLRVKHQACALGATAFSCSRAPCWHLKPPNPSGSREARVPKRTRPAERIRISAFAWVRRACSARRRPVATEDVGVLISDLFRASDFELWVLCVSRVSDNSLSGSEARAPAPQSRRGGSDVLVASPHPLPHAPCAMLHARPQARSRPGRLRRQSGLRFARPLLCCLPVAAPQRARGPRSEQAKRPRPSQRQPYALP